MGQWPGVLCIGSLVFGINRVVRHTGPCAVLPPSQFQSKAMELPHSAWVSVTGLMFEPEPAPSQECNAWVGWAGMVSAGLSGHTIWKQFC